MSRSGKHDARQRGLAATVERSSFRSVGSWRRAGAQVGTPSRPSLVVADRLDADRAGGRRAPRPTSAGPFGVAAPVRLPPDRRPRSTRPRTLLPSTQHTHRPHPARVRRLVAHRRDRGVGRFRARPARPRAHLVRRSRWTQLSPSCSPWVGSVRGVIGGEVEQLDDHAAGLGLSPAVGSEVGALTSGLPRRTMISALDRKPLADGRVDVALGLVLPACRCKSAVVA